MIIIESRNELLKIFDKNLKIAEIGVFKGDYSKYIFDVLQPCELHLIDLFHGDMCSGDKDGKNLETVNLDVEYENLKEYFIKNNNVFLHKGKSYDIMNNFDDFFFDIIYIDGDHSYDGVLLDLEISLLKIKNDGYIIGHDYTNIMFPDIVRAVDYFVNKYNFNINYLTRDGCPSFAIKINKKP
jgi:hypothetical protein